VSGLQEGGQGRRPRPRERGGPRPLPPSPRTRRPLPPPYPASPPPPPTTSVTEFMGCGSLADLFRANEVLSTRRCVQLAMDCARGIAYLHNRQPFSVVHRWGGWVPAGGGTVGGGGWGVGAGGLGGGATQGRQLAVGHARP
jgi:hypothetical protein